MKADENVFYVTKSRGVREASNLYDDIDRKTMIICSEQYHFYGFNIRWGGQVDT